MLVKELETLTNSQYTLEQQAMNMEGAETTRLTVGAISHGVRAQKEMAKQLNLDKVGKLLPFLFIFLTVGRGSHG